MFRKIDNHKRTASVGFVNGGWRITAMCDDGWDDIIDFWSPVANEAEGVETLKSMGYEEYDPNAHLKAMGMVFINGCYRMPPK
jgi:hypothetical protein